PDAADQADVGAEPTCGHGLIRALAAVVHEQRAVGDRLAGAGQAWSRDGEVHVGGADDENSRHRHPGGVHSRSRKVATKRARSTRSATRQFGAPAARRVSPSGPTVRRMVSHTTKLGSMATPTASGSCSVIPGTTSSPSPRKPYAANALTRSAMGPGHLANAASSSARVSTACRVASSGTSVSGNPASNTTPAASGSTYMLNSASGVT